MPNSAFDLDREASSAEIQLLNNDENDPQIAEIDVTDEVSDSSSHLTNSEKEDDLEDEGLPECLHFLGLTLTSTCKHEESESNKSSTTKERTGTETYLNPLKKPSLQEDEECIFAEPKVYICAYCNKKFYKFPLYFEHIKRHRVIIRCEICANAFFSLVAKKRHLLKCRRKAIL